MFPVILNFGPLSLRSFGLFLLLAFIACLFVVWKRTREEGFSEERVIDIFFLATGALILFGRIGFVISNWGTFQHDFGRIFLLFRYPGISFSTGLLAASILIIGVSRLFSLPSVSILDFVFLGVAAGTPFWFFGCFLDGCNQNNVWAPFVLSGFFVLLFIILRIVLAKIRKSPELYGLSKKAGWVTLCYLIFASLSFLITSYITGERVSNLTILVFVISTGAFFFRYFEFLKGVKWSSFPTIFSRKSADIWRIVGTILRRRSVT